MSASVILEELAPYGAIAALLVTGITQEISTPLLSGSQYKQGVGLSIMIGAAHCPKGFF